MCSICLDDNEENTIKTKCNHYFHKKCLSLWYENHEDCPYCRQKLNNKFIFRYDNDRIESNRIYYKHKDIIRKTITINGIETSFINKLLKNKYCKPTAWIKTPEIYPIYNMFWNNKMINITLYLRLYLLYSESKNVNIIQKCDLQDVIYYDIEDGFKNSLQPDKEYNLKCHSLIYGWIYELLHTLKVEYSFVFRTIYNTIIMDLYLLTLKKFAVSKNLFQTIIIASVYNAVKLIDNIEIHKNRLNWYTNNTSSMDEFMKFDSFLSEYIKHNLIKLI